jgi:hypothetical protein
MTNREHRRRREHRDQVQKVAAAKIGLGAR